MRYPVGKYDFKSIREGGYVYVDKTQFIPVLLEGTTYYFLARPRRFGKSMFLSTLEYFFLGEREIFRGLAVDSYDWDWKAYPVIRIDFGQSGYRSKTSLEEILDYILSGYERKYGVEKTSSNLQIRLLSLIKEAREKTGLKVVVLVDEYEKPVTDNIDNEEVKEHNREILRSFYQVLKSSDPYLKMVFLTGVTKFGQMSIFSGLNNLKDISMGFEFGSICGVTEEELKSTFKAGITKLAESSRIDFNGALRLLKDNYDGYHFNHKCPDIYNPYSIVHAFADGKIGSYWSVSGMPNLLSKVLKEHNYDLEKLNGVKTTERRLVGINADFDDPAALFYQTGYLTIKGYDPEDETYTLGFPNREVENAFFEGLMPVYSRMNNVETDTFIDRFRASLLSGDCKASMMLLKEFSSGISYDVIPKIDVERHFQNLIYIVSKTISSQKIRVSVEEKTSDGRIDMLIETPSYVYIIEIKYNGSTHEAIEQIKQKHYYLSFRTSGRKIFLVGLNFSSDKKRIDSFEIEEA